MMNIATPMLAAWIGFEALLTAGQAGPASMDVTLVGCVTQAARTGSLADDNRSGAASTPATAPRDANSAEPVDAYLLTNASRLAPKADAASPR
jgi:hypothetical protein